MSLPGIDPQSHEAVPRARQYCHAWMRIIMDARVKPAHDAENMARTTRTYRFTFQTANFQSTCAIARILCRGPGQARLGSVPLPFGRGGWSAARRNHQSNALRRGRALRGHGSPRGAPSAAFLSPAPCFRGAQRRQTSLRPGRLPPPVGAPASSHRRQPVLVPADDWPRPPGPAVTSRSGGRPSCSAFRIVSRRRPSIEQDAM